MLSPERFTVKTGEAIRGAQSIATERGNPVVNDAHLFLALLEQEEGIVVPLVQKSGLNVTELRQEAEREVERMPKQEGGGDRSAMSRELADALDKILFERFLLFAE